MLYTCTCGETKTEKIAKPVKNDSLKFSFDIVYQDKVSLRFRYLNTALAAYDDFDINIDYDYYVPANKFNKSSADTSINKNDFEVLGQSGAMISYGKTIALQAMYELNLPVKAVAYCKDSSGVIVAYKEICNTTVKDVLLNTMATLTTTAQKTALIDLINYAEAARVHFGALNAGGDLSKSDSISADFAAYQEFASTATEFDYNTEFSRPTGDLTIAPDFIIGASNDIRFRIITNTAKINESDYVVDVSYTDGFTKKVVSLGQQSLTDVELLASQGGRNARACLFSKLALYDFNKTVTLNIYKKDNLGGEPAYTATYCLEKYVSDNLASTSTATATEKNLLIAAMRFSNASRVLYGIS